MTALWNEPRLVYGSYRVDVHRLTPAQYDALLEHPASRLSYYMRDAQSCTLWLEEKLVLKWGVEYVVDWLREDVLDAPITRYEAIDRACDHLFAEGMLKYPGGQWRGGAWESAA